MKKIFSAFLLMTMMVFSVGSFVSCSDLENEIAKVDSQATENAAAIADLNSKLTALQTALTAAQADADAAMAAAQAAQKAGDDAKAQAEAAKAAAATAKAEAIAEATAKIEAVKAELEKAIAVNSSDIEALKVAVSEHVYAITNLTGQVEAQEVSIEALQVQVKTMEATLVKYGENLAALGLLTDDITAAISQNVAAIQNLSGRVDAIEAEYGAELDAVKAAISQNVGSIQNLKTQLETLEAEIDGQLNTLEKELAKVNEAIKAINANLVLAVQAIAGQIQSITYVPENLDGTIASNGYSYKSGNSTVKTILFSATYDVRPANLASTITVDNASFSGVKVKAEAAESFQVMKVEADDATGRVVVYGKVASSQKAYKTLVRTDKNNSGVVLSNGVAVALNVNMNADVTVEETETDLGTKISSNYANILPLSVDNSGVAVFSNIYDRFVLATADNKTVARKGETYKNYATTDNVNTPNDERNGIEVPYNYVGSAAAQKSLFPVSVKVEILDGVFVTPEYASDLLGKTLEVKYVAKIGSADVKAVYSKKTDIADRNNDGKVTPPIVVTGTDLTATADLVTSPDYEGKQTIGEYAVLALGTWSVDNVNLGLAAESKYTIVDGKSDAAISFEPVEKPWSYKLGDDAIFSTTELKELAVTVLADVTDIQKLFNGNETFTAKWEDTNYKYEATAVVKALSTKAVQLVSFGGQTRTKKPNTQNTTDATFNYLQYPQGQAVTRTFEATLKHTDSKIDYTVAFDVNLGAMPTDEEAKIDLGTYNINGSIGKEMNIENGKNGFVVDPVAKALELIAQYDSKINEATAMPTYSTSGAKVKIGTNEAVNYVSTTDGHVKINFTPYFKDSKFNADKSSILVNKLGDLGYSNTIKATQKVNLCGVDFTYTATVKTAKPEVTFKPAVAYVDVDSNNKVSLDGTVKLPISNGVTGTKTPYALNAIDLRNYVDVTIPTELSNDFVIRYTLKENPFVKEYNTNGTPKTYKDIPNSTTDPKAKFNKSYLPEFTTTVADAVVENTNETTTAKLVPTEKCPINWKSQMREMTYEIALVSKTLIDADGDGTADDDDVFASFDVTLVVPELIKTFSADNQLKVKYENGATAASTNIVGAFNIVDKFDNVIYNAFARNYGEMWDGYVLNKKGELVSVNDDLFFQVYGQSIIFPADDKVKAYKGSTDVTSQVKPILNTTTGALTIKAESATLTGDIEVKVPVTLTYLYDEYGVQAKETTVSVLFTLSADGEESGEVSIEDTPDLKQWILDSRDVYVEAFGGEEAFAEFVSYYPDAVAPRVVFDFGLSYEGVNAKIDALGIPEANFPRWTENTFAFAVSYEDLYGAADTWAAERYFDYKVDATDPTSGRIVFEQYDREFEEYVEVGSIPYSNYTGSTCTFDIAILLNSEEPYVVTAKLLNETIQALPQELINY